MGTIPSLKTKGDKELQISDVDDGSSAAGSQLEVDDQSENNESQASMSETRIRAQR